MIVIQAKKLSSVEQKEEDSLVQSELRRFEEKLENTQNISDILKQDDMSVAHMSMDSGACANTDKVRQLTGETQFEDYSLEVAPKIPSYTAEINSINRKAEKPFPWDNASVNTTGEFDANSQEGFNSNADGVLSLDTEFQSSDASNLTSDQSPEIGDNLHCEKDFKKHGGNTGISSESTFLEKTRNVHKLNGGIKSESSRNLADQSMFPDQINDTALGGDYAGSGGDQLAAQQGACVKEKKSVFSSVMDTLKSKSLRKGVFKAIEITYNSLR